MHILIAEDEKIFLKILKEEFEEIGFKVTPTSNGSEALKELKAKSREINLVLLDLMMPVIDGFQVLEEIKNDQVYGLSSIPVIVLSNLGQDDEIKRAFKLGATDYFVKSQHPISEVIEKVKNYLEKPRVDHYKKQDTSESEKSRHEVEDSQSQKESGEEVSVNKGDSSKANIIQEAKEAATLEAREAKEAKAKEAEEYYSQKVRKLKVKSED